MSAPTTGSSTPDGTGGGRLKRSIASFDNLVSLANHAELLKGTRKLVWRDKGQPVIELSGLEACLEHAAAGGLRKSNAGAATLAFNIRAGFNLILALIRLPSVPRERRLSLLSRALFGPDSFRMAAMLGTFVSVYKFLLNSMPLLIPSIRPPPSRNLSTSQQTSVFAQEGELSDLPEDIDLEAGISFPLRQNTSLEVPSSGINKRVTRLSLSTNAQLILIRKKTRRWHAALAGAIAGGLAIMWEKKGRRGVIAQQMFVRGLQGSYNSFAEKRNIHVPHGAVLVFSVACGQILYAWLLRPDTLPRSYSNWVSNAAKVPREAVRMNHSLFREHSVNFADIDVLTASQRITDVNRGRLLALQDKLLNSVSSSYIPSFAPCSAVHPAQTSCLEVPLDRFVAVFKWMIPIYGGLHLVPMILFKRELFVKEPLTMIFKAGYGATRSSAFLGLFVVIYQSLNCFNHQSHEYLSTLRKGSKLKFPQSFLDSLFASKASFWLPGFLAGLSLFVEEKKRRAELAMYVLPKALESAWIIGRNKVGILKRLRGGDTILSAFAMAMVMSTYQNDPQHLSGLVRRIMYQFIGPN